METALTLNWSTLLNFTKDEVEKLAEVEAVFRISRKADDGQFYVFYVGSTGSLKKDLLSITNGQSGNAVLDSVILAGGTFSFRYALVNGEELRNAIQKQMYRKYAPSANDREPVSSVEVKVNLS